jgi:hypothetical protein
LCRGVRLTRAFLSGFRLSWALLPDFIFRLSTAQSQSNCAIMFVSKIISPAHS